MDIYVVLEGILRQLGFDGVGIITLYSLTVLAARLVARFIPDDKTGFLGLVRKVSRVVGLDLSNRISSGVSQNDVAKATMTIANVARIAQQPRVPIVNTSDKDK